ncbi:MAG: NAD(P)(+) transhydrogenase (Re/Si-specific) subunit beta [Candidatus Hydrogenedentes bacterium]|nr:NAD(P)(+) transhydrogenase (Re/Si-specific) subunit beta [Candidatus Hydrogenedentota bacterium]
MNLPGTVVALGYIIAALLFIRGLQLLGKAETARRGNIISAFGMLLAVVATVLSPHFQFSGYAWVLPGIAIGGLIGYIAAVRVPMTSMPEFVALFNGFGGIASLLVGCAEYIRGRENFAHSVPENIAELITTLNGSGYIVESESGPVWFTVLAIYLAVLIGGVTFTGSLIAYAKLAGRIGGKPVLFTGQQFLNGALLVAVVLLGALFVWHPETMWMPLAACVVISFILGVLVTIPIGGADMPVVISLLNSYSGLAACAAGFIIGNTVLIVSGALVGASGLILTSIMCKAMNRSLTNVLFSGFGSTTTSSKAAEHGEAKSMTPADAFYVLEAAGSVVFVPGYGMAVAQAQHVVKELGDILEKNGADVKYAVHPVAGRMPGHMNVLLAEANVPYEQLVEMDDINPVIETVDVAVVIGANDVVNPAAREDESSPIFGMPIINVDKARTVFILKRSMASGFAGIDNPLFFKENAQMIFGDAKTTIQALVGEFKES